MPSTTLFSKTGKELGKVDLPETLFAAPVNEAVMHQAVMAQLAARRTGTARHQDPRRGPRRRRQAVPPEGHRPRPPGLERAHRTTRAAASSSVRTRASYEQRLPKRMKRARAPGRPDRRSSATAPIKVVEDLALDAPKTRELVGYLDALKATGRVLVVATGGKDANLELSARNLPGVVIIRADSLNIVDVLNADTLLITQPVARDHGGGVRMTLHAAEVVLKPVISEKSMDETQRNKYTFAVHDDANKLQIKDAVEELFKVNVLEVNVLTNKPRRRAATASAAGSRAGRRPGRRPS